MKIRIRQTKAGTGINHKNVTQEIVPTSEEIRQRAYEIFLARGGTPGKEMEDWLRAEQELKRERAVLKTPSGRGFV